MLSFIRVFAGLYILFCVSFTAFAGDEADSSTEGGLPPPIVLPNGNETLVPSGNIYVNPSDGKVYVPLGGNSVLDTSTGEVHP